MRAYLFVPLFHFVAQALALFVEDRNLPSFLNQGPLQKG